MRGFDADNHVRIFPRHFRHEAGIHVALIPIHGIVCAEHTRADYFNHRWDASSGRVDDAAPEFGEVAPPGARQPS